MCETIGQEKSAVAGGQPSGDAVEEAWREDHGLADSRPLPIWREITPAPRHQPGKEFRLDITPRFAVSVHQNEYDGKTWWSFAGSLITTFAAGGKEEAEAKSLREAIAAIREALPVLERLAFPTDPVAEAISVIDAEAA
jgi:hypothetical protein